MSKKGVLGFIFLLILVLLIVISAVTFFYINKKVIGYAEYDVDYDVGKTAGFNLDADAIHFGTVYFGVSNSRNIVISTDRDAIIRMYLSGLDNIWIDKNNFFLSANETETVKLTLEVPEGVEEGHYSGKLRILYFLP